MRYSTAFPEKVVTQAERHLIRQDRQEDLCFAVYFPSAGSDRYSGLVHTILLPKPGERSVHGNVSFNPQYLERALRKAAKLGGGLAFFHSHPFPGWQHMSEPDVAAEEMLAPRAMAATGLALLGATVGSDGSWSARFWPKTGPRLYRREWCDSVRVVGKKLRVTFDDRQLPVPVFGEELTRTLSAWGPDKQALLARLRVGVIGGGSVGQIVGMSLAKSGVQDVLVMDFDRAKLINRDRLAFFRRDKVAARPFKTDLLADGMEECATSDRFEARRSYYSICEPEGLALALGCDVLFSCVDRPWPRAVLNLIANAHLIPVIDGGLYLSTLPENKGLRHADWTVQTVTPETACLECLGQCPPGMVSAERDGSFDDPVYIQGLPEDHLAMRRENVFPFSAALATDEILEFLALTVAPTQRPPTAFRRRFVFGGIEPSLGKCNRGCLYHSYVALGDRAPVSMTGKHPSAEESRRSASGDSSEGVIRF